MPTKKPSEIGLALRRAREAAGISQSELGRMTKMSVGQISQVETGERQSPAFLTVQKMARALHISLDGLTKAGDPKMPDFPASAAERLSLRREIHLLQAELRKSLERADELMRRLDGAAPKPRAKKKR